MGRAGGGAGGRVGPRLSLLPNHPPVGLDLGNGKTLSGVKDQHPTNQVLAVCGRNRSMNV